MCFLLAAVACSGAVASAYAATPSGGGTSVSFSVVIPVSNIGTSHLAPYQVLVVLPAGLTTYHLGVLS